MSLDRHINHDQMHKLAHQHKLASMTWSWSLVSVSFRPMLQSGLTAVTANNLVSLMRGPDEVGSRVTVQVLKGHLQSPCLTIPFNLACFSTCAHIFLKSSACNTASCVMMEEHGPTLQEQQANKQTADPHLSVSTSTSGAQIFVPSKRYPLTCLLKQLGAWSPSP
jgi:hypothetical protein